MEYLDIRESLVEDDKKALWDQLKTDLKSIMNDKQIEGILYLGYPIVWSSNDSWKIDALLISQKQGIYIFSLIPNPTEDLLNWEQKNQRYMKRVLAQKFMWNDIFFDEDTWGINVDIKLVSYSSENFRDRFSTLEKSRLYGLLGTSQIIPFALSKTELEKSIFGGKVKPLEEKKYETALSVIQDLINLKPKKKRKITKEGSLWDKLNKSEAEIANLDPRQEKAVIKFFDGIQRIRGLAGSGKTIVLALKVAQFHLMRPEAKIAVTFHTRSLKQQFIDKIEAFCISKNWDKPDWSKIDIIHAWGTQKEWKEGIYLNIARRLWINYYNLWQSKKFAEQYNTTEFDAICIEMLKEIGEYKKNNTLVPEYDMIFVDEAQDLSENFLKICYEILNPTKEGKRRLVYAYDELQKLDEGAFLPDPEKIFWEPIINPDDQDIILPKCYRNSREVITSAHWLWFGIYRKQSSIIGSPLVQFFDDPELWKDIGYKTNDQLEWGNIVTLYRDNETSPSYFSTYYQSQEFVNFHKFDNLAQEANFVANSIENDIKNEDLEHNDILVIYLWDWKSAQKLNWIISETLFTKGIKTYFAWEDSPDIFYKSDAVTITWIRRAKWNEVWRVYIIWAENCYRGDINDAFELKQKRNSLFVAITRSKWTVNICWVWSDFELLTKEFSDLRDKNYYLNFRYPTPEEIQKMNTVYRSVDQKSIKTMKNDIKGAYEFISIIKRIQDWEVDIADYPEEIQLLIKKVANADKWDL